MAQFRRLFGRALVALVALVAAGCAAPTLGTPDKDAFRDSKADGDVPSARVCVSLGAAPTCDVCRVAGWYEDGECDGFCRYRDADCDTTFADDAIQWRCDTIRDEAQSCAGGAAISASCLPDAGDGASYEAALECCAWRREWCEALPAPDERYAPAIRWVLVPYRLRELDAGASGRHRVAAYAPESFSAARFAGELVARDRDARGCAARTYSTSRASGVQLYEAFLAEADPHAGDSFAAGRILEELRDPANPAVFASVPASDDPECAYRDFFAFRPDGTVLHLGYDDRPAGSDLASAEDLDGIRYVPEADLDTWSRMHEYGHNGGSSIGFWSEAALDHDALTTHVRVHDASSYGCVDRGISADTEEALTRYAAHTESGFHMFEYVGEDSIEDEYPGFGADRDLIDAYVRDPSNRAVVSSEFTREDRDDPTSCLIYDFYVLRDDGVAVRFSVNQTD